jgi:uncharacterized protein (TIGR02599 family)
VSFPADQGVKERAVAVTETFLPRSRRSRTSGFTLTEILVATTILVIIIGILFTMTQQTGKVWKNTSGKVEVFRTARNAFEAMTRTLSQATLNTYYDYVYSVTGSGSTSQWSFTPTGNAPISYARNSDLRIVSGLTSTQTTLLPSLSGGYTAVTHAVFFQAPLGVTAQTTDANLTGLMNSCGFYVIYGPDNLQPTFDSRPKRYRYRLMEYLPPSEYDYIYYGGKSSNVWFATQLNSDITSTNPKWNFVLADNVVALVILPKLSAKDEAAADTAYSLSAPLGTALAPNYSYDSLYSGQGGTINSTTGKSAYPLLNSCNQMPPIFTVTMVAIDEASALKLGNTTTPPNAALGITSTLFTNATLYQQDLTTLENNLAAVPGNAAGNKIKLNFHVFQTDVAMRGAHWTSDN